jgi:hypothetical protein
MSALAASALAAGTPPSPLRMELHELGELTPLGRPGGQGRVYRAPGTPGGPWVAVKLYRRAPSPAAARLLAEMIAWSRSLEAGEFERLRSTAAWPRALVTQRGSPVGIVMDDVSVRFEVPFRMPSGRLQPVLLSLEHLLGADDFLILRGLPVVLDTTTRALVAERVSAALAFLHRHGIVASDISPNNLLVAFDDARAHVGFRHAPLGVRPRVGLIDCDSMVFRGRQALPAVETADWQMPPEFAESPRTRAADAYKLGLVVLRLFARSHDARALGPHADRVPAELLGLLNRALSAVPANRPAAGEWQRALGRVLERGGLNARYPGPPPARLRPRAAPVPPGRAGQVTPPPGRAPAAPAPRRSPAPALPLALLVVTVIVFVLILVRLLVALTPQVGGSGFTSQGGTPTPYYYYAPPGGGSR